MEADILKTGISKPEIKPKWSTWLHTTRVCFVSFQSAPNLLHTTQFSLIYFKNRFLLMTHPNIYTVGIHQWARFSYLHNASTKSYKYLVGFMSKYRYNTLRTGNREFKWFIKQLSQQIYKCKCMIEKKWPIVNYCKTSPTSNSVQASSWESMKEGGMLFYDSVLKSSDKGRHLM